MALQSPDLEALVRKSFEVTNMFQLPDGEMEFGVKYSAESGRKFEALAGELATLGMKPHLTGTKEEAVLTLRKDGPTKAPSRTAVVFALLTLISVVVFSLLQVPLYQALAPDVSEALVFFTMSMALVLPMAAHELGRWFVAKRRSAGAVNQYLIPGVPFLPPFIPSLGFASLQRGEALNRDSYFDALIAGPLSMLLVAVALYVFGYLTAFPSTVTVLQAHLSNSTVTINNNTIQLGLNAVLSPLVLAPPAGYALLSPVADAAGVGFILVFIGLLPMAAYTGGHLSTMAWGQRASRIATYLVVVLLLAIDIPNYFYFSLVIVILVMAGRTYQLRYLDEVSDLSQNRKWIYLAALLIALLCIPLPNTFATLPI